MENQHLDELIEKYILKTASIEEQQELLDWYNTQNNAEVAWRSDQLNEEVLVKRRLLSNINERIQPKVKSISLWPRIAGIAAAVAAITLGVWLYNISSTLRHPDHEVAAKQIFSGSDIAPGKNTATITLANGETINLSDSKTGVVVGNELTYNDGSVVANLSPSGREEGVVREGSRVQTLTASTPRGGTYQVTLPDGTHVWLNADSKISFPSQFSGKQRKISLIGEAYFEVSQNKRMPFIVESKGQQVEVLGTHFNITAYNDETSIKTTLLEGSVRVTILGPQQILNHKSETVTLVPNQQSTITGSNRIEVANVDANETIAWKNGYFNFKAESLESVMRKLSRWYNIEVEYKGDLSDVLVGGEIPRNTGLSQVLQVLEAADINFTIKGNKLIVKP